MPTFCHLTLPFFEFINRGIFFKSYKHPPQSLAAFPRRFQENASRDHLDAPRVPGIPASSGGRDAGVTYAFRNAMKGLQGRVGTAGEGAQLHIVKSNQPQHALVCCPPPSVVLKILTDGYQSLIVVATVPLC